MSTVSIKLCHQYAVCRTRDTYESSKWPSNLVRAQVSPCLPDARDMLNISNFAIYLCYQLPFWKSRISLQGHCKLPQTKSLCPIWYFRQMRILLHHFAVHRAQLMALYCAAPFGGEILHKIVEYTVLKYNMVKDWPLVHSKWLFKRILFHFKVPVASDL